jgi:hypothetical protein
VELADKEKLARWARIWVIKVENLGEEFGEKLKKIRCSITSGIKASATSVTSRVMLGRKVAKPASAMNPRQVV